MTRSSSHAKPKSAYFIARPRISYPSLESSKKRDIKLGSLEGLKDRSGMDKLIKTNGGLMKLTALSNSVASSDSSEVASGSSIERSPELLFTWY